MFLPGEVVKKEKGKVYFRLVNGNMVLILNENEITLSNDGVSIPDNVASNSPWIQLADKIKNKKYFIPRETDDGLEMVVPVANTDENEFLGYHAVIDKNNSIVKILDAGKYVRFTQKGLEKYTAMLPVQKIADVSELTKEEFGMMVDGTPVNYLPKIYEYDEQLAGAVTAEKLRRDPLSLTELKEDDLTKLLKVATEYWVIASPESNPAVIAMLIEELRSVAPTAVPELEYLMGRLREERHEEKQIEKMKQEIDKTYEDWQRRIREEELKRRARQTIRETKEILKELLGITIPIIIQTTPAIGMRQIIVKSAERAGEAMKEGEREKVVE